MRLTIFWRVIFAQLTLIALILVVSLYALSQLHWLANLSTGILATDAVSIEAEKRLLKVFLSQMRSAEKYFLLRDKELYSHFTVGSSDFTSAIEKVATLVDTPQERALLAQIRELYSRYAAGLSTDFTPKSAWNQEKTEISDGITSRVNELIRFREETIAHKTAATRDQAVLAASMIGWLSLGGIMAAILFAYVHARGVSQPLKKLARALFCVGQGEFPSALDVRGPHRSQRTGSGF